MTKTAQIIPFPTRPPQDKAEAKRKLRERTRLPTIEELLGFDDIA